MERPSSGRRGPVALCHHSAPCRESSRRKSRSTAVPGCLPGLPDWTAVAPRPLSGGGGVNTSHEPSEGRPSRELSAPRGTVLGANRCPLW